MPGLLLSRGPGARGDRGLFSVGYARLNGWTMALRGAVDFKKVGQISETRWLSPEEIQGNELLTRPKKKGFAKFGRRPGSSRRKTVILESGFSSPMGEKG